MSSEKKLTLQSSDGEKFEIEESAAVKSTMLKNMIEDNCASNTIPVANIDGKTLAMVVEYCKKHANRDTEPDDDLKSFDAQFLDKDQAVLYDLLMAANYLDVQGLLDGICQKVADMIKGKSPEDIRKTFNIVSDFSPEEEEEIRKENTWAFE